MKPCHLFLLIALFLPGLTGTSAAQTTMEPWLTRSADNSRSGWNPHENQLTQASVATKGIIRATIIPVVGDARGMEAQPLILPNVKTALGTRDVLVLPSMADVVRGVDAHDGSSIWQVTLGVPVTGSQTIDMHQINQHWGCLSTGVIDPDTQRLYQVCWVSPDKSGDPATARYFMFVLNVADGSDVVPPVLIEGKSWKSGLQRGDAQTAFIAGGDQRQRRQDGARVLGDDLRDGGGRIRLLLRLRRRDQQGKRDAGTDGRRRRRCLDGRTRRRGRCARFPLCHHRKRRFRRREPMGRIGPQAAIHAAVGKHGGHAEGG